MWKGKGIRIAKISLKVGEIKLPDFKIYFKALVTKIM